LALFFIGITIVAWARYTNWLTSGKAGNVVQRKKDLI
jgi:hypothetical protein